MKGLKKAAVFGIAAAIVCGTGLLSACRKNGDGILGELSDSEWEKYLDIDVEKCKSITVDLTLHFTYPKEEAAKYGEWQYERHFYKIDLENEIMYKLDEEEGFEKSSGNFVKDTDEKYYFAYQDQYYEWSNGKVYETTKAEFIMETESVANAALQIRQYKDPKSKESFRYNEETGCYDLTQYGTAGTSLRFSEDGSVTMIARGSSITGGEIAISAVDKTKVEIPENVKGDVDIYIAQKGSEK